MAGMQFFLSTMDGDLAIGSYVLTACIFCLCVVPRLLLNSFNNSSYDVSK